MMTRSRLALLALALAPALLGVKCFEPIAAPGSDAGVDAAPRADAAPGTPDAALFTAAVACADPGTARVRIVDHSFEPQCGCKEATGKTCTVPRGTNVIWEFEDSDEHDVASDGDSFGSSGEQLAGTFAFMFGMAGTYTYGCTIHAEMTGYTIVVVE